MMRCTEFRRRFHHMLDTKQPRVFGGGMSAHVESCRRCAAHVAAMERIDAGLRAAPEIEVPPDLLGKLLTIPSRFATQVQLPSWGAEIRRTSFYAVPTVLLAIGCLALAPELQFLFQTAIATIAFVIVAMQRLRPRSGTQ